MSSATPLPSLLLNAARSAAVADGLAPPISQAQARTQGIDSSEKDEQCKKEEAAVAGLRMVANAAGRNAVPRPVSNESQDNNTSNLIKKNNVSNVVVPISNSLNSSDNKNLYRRPNGGLSSLPASATTPAPNYRPKTSKSSTVKALNPPRSTSNVSSSQSQTSSSTPSSSKSSSSSKSKGPLLRRGKWTSEEENYANRLIQEFKSGLLPLTDGTTLRTFLSKLLNCDPMRISKKFVGSNCIGKQVFRRRTADINRLSPEHIERSRKELSELERRFLERVAQTNRVKSNGAVGAVPVAPPPKPKVEEEAMQSVPTHNPPWLRPPNGFKPSGSKGSSNSRAAAVGRALLQGSSSALPSSGGLQRKSSKQGLNLSRSHGSAGLLAMIEMQRKKSEQDLLRNAVQRNSANNLLNAAVSSANNGGLSNTAMTQIARNASAARIAGMAASGHSLNSLMLKTGLSRDQLTQLARDQQGASTQSLSNMLERQSSFDALMSLDFQSLQSIDNLANLIQSGGSAGGLSNLPKSGLKNWESGSQSNMSSLADARRRVSEGRMENLIRTLSSGNAGSMNGLAGSHGGGSNATFGNLLQSMQNMGSANSLFSSGNLSNAMLANMLRTDSSTGLTALRMQDGLLQRNSSVDDFLSLVASGDIPHQDPHLLNVPLQSVMHQQQQHQHDTSQNQNDGNAGGQSAAAFFARQQLLQAVNGNKSLSNAMLSSLGSKSGSNSLSNAMLSSLGSKSGSNSLSNAMLSSLGSKSGSNSLSNAMLSSLASKSGSNSLSNAMLSSLGSKNGNNSLSNAMLSNLGNNSSASFLNQLTNSQRNSSVTNAAAAAYAQQQQQARAAQMNLGASALSLARAQQQSSNGLKRKTTEDMLTQGPSKR